MAPARNAAPRRAKPARITDAAPLFAALGDEKRLSLVARLCSGGPASITGLAAGSPVTRQAVTKHLRVMEQAGLVRSFRRGRERLWQMDPRSLNQARRYLDQISTQWDVALARLKSFVE